MAWTGIKLTNEQIRRFAWLYGYENIPDFKHTRLTKLSAEQRDNFRYDLGLLFVEIGVNIHSQNRFYSNETIIDKLKSLDSHVKKTRKQLDMPILDILMEAANNDEAEKIIEFKNLLLLFATLINRSLKRKTFKASSANIYDFITFESYFLLIKYNIKPTLTKAGAWEKLIEYFTVNHSLKLPAELKNSMRRISKRCKTAEKIPANHT